MLFNLYSCITVIDFLLFSERLDLVIMHTNDSLLAVGWQDIVNEPVGLKAA